MGFFTKILGIDLGIRNYAKAIASLVEIYKEALNSREILLNLLNNSKIVASTNDKYTDSLMWKIKLSPELLKFYVDSTNEFLTLQFEYGLEPIKITAFKNGESFYNISYKYKIDELSETCKIFTEALEVNGIKKI
ncbi:hypothetical protein [Aliarcobacter cryaerophilus]|uniref:hypothetical protein n=1 Tax=Aliarcobacter cryaerophilus TaxID=28198 RepID=UPI003DA39C93